MNRRTLPLYLVSLLGAVPLLTGALGAPAPARQDDRDLESMMAKMQAIRNPGKNHAYLERFLGKWDVEMSVVMPGAPPPSKGSAEYTWLFDGYWLQSRMSTSLMGMPFQSAAILGYDNFKQSFVATRVSTMDTAMLYSEGDLGPDGETLLLYGTIDEYLTGEHDKMSRTVYRWKSPDEFLVEVHDFAIGEENTKVIEMRFRRAD